MGARILGGAPSIAASNVWILPPFARLAGETDYETLRPDVWRTAHPDAIRQYRVEERRDKADRKQFRRAPRRLTAATSTA